MITFRDFAKAGLIVGLLLTPCFAASNQAQGIIAGPGQGESAAGQAVIDSGVFSAPGDAALEHAQLKGQANSGTLQTLFGKDVKVRPNNFNSREWNQTVAAGKNGYLYMAWQDDYFTYDYIQLYYSKDGGKSWTPFGYLQSDWADLEEPSITVAEGDVSKTLLVAYIVDDGFNTPFPEVAISKLDTPDFSPRHVPHYSGWQDYRKPVIWSSTVGSTNWIAFLTCEGVFDILSKNINICAWRSTDWGVTWSSQNTILGDNDSYAWKDPDGAWMPHSNMNMIVCYNDTTNAITKMISYDFGLSYGGQADIVTFGKVPGYPVNPEVEGSRYTDDVMLCFTRAAGVANIGYKYSQNNGSTWTSTLNVPGCRSDLAEFAPSLSASATGNGFHLAFSREDGHVLYNQASQSSGTWNFIANIVDDMGAAHPDYPHYQKGIACQWNAYKPVIAWSDNRDGGSDRDTYADFGDNLGLSVNDHTLPESAGGMIVFHLNAGETKMYRNYFLLGSISGPSPGTPLPSGLVLPLKWDIFTTLTFKMANLSPFLFFHGPLDSAGESVAELHLLGLIPPGSVGIKMHFAYLLYNPIDYVSNPVEIEIVP